MTITHHIENINKDRNYSKKNQTNILELINTIMEIKNSLERRCSTADLREHKRISDLEDRSI